MALAADYSYARPTPAALRAAGFTAVLRYLSHEPGKNLSLAERDALHAAGLAIGLVWETIANRVLAGFDAGRLDAIEANRQADLLGWPTDRALFYAVDFDATGAQVVGPISDYFRGANSVGRRSRGVYGHYGVIETIVGGGLVPCGWQCAGWSGSGQGTGGSIGGRRLSRHACLFQHPYQVLGGACDPNDVLMDPGPWAWHPNQPAARPAQEDDMINWRPVHCPEFGDAQWLLTFDGDGRPRRLFLGPGEPGFYWGLGWIQDTNPLVKRDDEARRFMAIPEALPHDLVALADVDESALAQALAGPLAEGVATRLRAEGTAVGIDVGQLDDLIARVTAAGQALAGPQG